MKKNEKGSSKSVQEFRVQLEGIDLPEEYVDRISKSLQKAVLAELVELDVAPRFGVGPVVTGNGPTQGIHVTAKEKEII